MCGIYAGLKSKKRQGKEKDGERGDKYERRKSGDRYTRKQLKLCRVWKGKREERERKIWKLKGKGFHIGRLGSRHRSENFSQANASRQNEHVSGSRHPIARPT
jgi:hypothetical protein